MAYKETKEGPAVCKRCLKRIRMIKKTQGKLEAVNPDPVGFVQIYSPNGYDRYVLEDGRSVYGRSVRHGEQPTEYGYVPHKYTCEAKPL